MKCDIILDLLPLYADGICSDDSKREIEDHLKNCELCQAKLNKMRGDLAEDTVSPIRSARVRNKIGLLKASVLHSACMILAFLCLVYGVYREASIPAGALNGIMAFGTVVPATGFLLSLVNWHFVRFYNSKRSFALWSGAITAILTILLWMWCICHYDMFYILTDSADSLIHFLNRFVARGAVLTAVLSVISVASSSLYAMLIGKE